MDPRLRMTYVWYGVLPVVYRLTGFNCRNLGNVSNFMACIEGFLMLPTFQAFRRATPR